MSPVLAWGDFHARSRFARSTIPEEKWGTTRSLWCFKSDQFLSFRWITLWTTMPMAPVKLEHRVYFQAKPSTKYPATPLFPTVATHLVMDMHTPPSGLVLHPAHRLSGISPLPIKRFFKSCFGRPYFLSSAHHFGCPSRTNHCTPPQTANSVV